MASSSTNNIITSVPIFSGELYEFWSDKMETLLKSQDLWDIVKDGPAISGKSTDTTVKHSKEEMKRDAYALHLIHQGIDAQIYPRIFGSKSAQEAWERLESEYKGSKKVVKIKLQNLRRQFDALFMKENEVSKDYFARVTGIVNQIRILGGVLDEQQVVEKVLRSLPKTYNHIVFEAHDLEELSVTELKRFLQSHEDLFNRDSTVLDKSFHTKMNLKQKQDKNQNQREGSKNGNMRREGKQKTNSYRAPENVFNSCIICKKQNHETKDCYFRCKKCKIQNHSEQKCWFRKKEEAKFTETDSDKYVFTCQKEECTHSHLWFIDSECSSHMSNNCDYFISLNENCKSEVILGDGKKKRIEGKGIISVKAADGEQKLM